MTAYQKQDLHSENLKKTSISRYESELIWQEYANKRITDIKKYRTSFDDGSEWAIGYWWQTTIENWEIGDIIHISTPDDLAYYFYKIDNLTKQEAVWSTNFIRKPDPNFAKCLWIYEIKKNETGYSIKMNNGIILEIPAHRKKTFIDWQFGDVLTVLKSSWPDDQPALLNHHSYQINGLYDIPVKIE